MRSEIRSQYIVLIQSHKHDAALPIVSLGKKLYERYSNAEIYYVSNKKVKILTTDIDTANKIAADDELNKKFLVSIPQDLCEVKAVCPLPLDYLEHYIFQHAKPKNMSHFGDVPDTCTITEVRRFQRKASNSNLKIDINLVSICFSGNVLPSHICLDGVNYPLKPYREPVLQCKRCWHYNHSEKACSRPHAICENCGLAHDLSVSCQSNPFCINCKGSHPASHKDCPIFKRFLNEKIAKAEKIKPKPINLFNPTISYAGSLSLDINSFPALGTPMYSKNQNRNRSVSKISQNKRARVDDPANCSASAPDQSTIATQLTSPIHFLQHSVPSNPTNEIKTNNCVTFEKKNASFDFDTEMLQHEINSNQIAVAAEEVVSTQPTQNVTNNLINFETITPKSKLTTAPQITSINLPSDNKHENNSLQRNQCPK